MTPQELRNSILQRAMEGKLVEQRIEEKVDIASINDNKNKNIEEYELHLPDNWTLSTIEGISKSISTKKFQIKQTQVQKMGKYPVISQSNEYVIGYSDEKSKLFNNKKTVVVFGDHTTNVKYVDFDFIVGADGLKIFEPLDVVDSKYMYYCLTLFSFGLEKKGGYSRHYKFIKDKALPIPPIQEQNRIVEKIEELLPLVDDYEKNWQKLEDLNKKFPEDMKKSLLQEAIKGKLVEQRPEEGTGEDLYELIQEEKNKLIQEGKIKKQKALPEIKEDEMPFDIPESWRWVRLGDVSDYNNMKKKVKANEIDPNTWCLDLEDIEKESGIINKISYAKDKIIKGEKIVFNKNQILYSKLRPYLKKILVAPEQGVCSSEIVPFSCYSDMNPDFIVYLLKSPYIDNLVNSLSYGVKMPRVGTDTMINLLIPLPSKVEQKRITEKLEELLPLCDQLAQKQ